ncbi:Hypothetical protein FKW44_020541 [Caligus rogercresseyi]|uniref:Uncharacterized protein n=1 Tax=Caligus rogercresseyi TaxID=217165 RepID=A0A7T8GXG3_CALRO|nr:Hypothetical protein FKW44_020541 [Caligus rogercresseyi]
MLARTETSVQECVYWYNIIPNGESDTPLSRRSSGESGVTLSSARTWRID